MTIKEMLISNQILNNDDIDFILSVNQDVSPLFELEDNDDNWDVLVDELQQTSNYLTGDGESVSDRTKKFDDLVDKISAI
ncbi:TPA: hypothetical protein VD138_001752 [Streptococcus pyogenes]|uniref:hypothetical protein n=1 Tax=Streptococcus TaxID=1301 RepID=UPI0004BE3CE2|nr:MULTISPECIES: hypothetical protein [Streptococcus]QBX28814.1 hypothetical protein Javan470_0032 [Streptococcus phage Javan470]MCY7049311.1 hypothetical protein [Streptococcus pyogenes]QCK31851.1 hypothetical protein ETT69_03280 [Streptococcus pyogenes]QJD63355.1 hypothetical protein HHM65_02865 [Streptococcus dysgalactiae subsp. equisimilis]QJR39765.1 hypothetical protein HHM66_07935 [Streptococcus dysgalactiae subsp. equisimilis]